MFSRRKSYDTINGQRGFINRLVFRRHSTAYYGDECINWHRVNDIVRIYINVLDDKSDGTNNISRLGYEHVSRKKKISTRSLPTAISTARHREIDIFCSVLFVFRTRTAGRNNRGGRRKRIEIIIIKKKNNSANKNSHNNNIKSSRDFRSVFINITTNNTIIRFRSRRRHRATTEPRGGGSDGIIIRNAVNVLYVGLYNNNNNNTARGAAPRSWQTSPGGVYTTRITFVRDLTWLLLYSI